MVLGGMRSASFVTDEPCPAYRLSQEALARMNHESADLAWPFIII